MKTLVLYFVINICVCAGDRGFVNSTIQSIKLTCNDDTLETFPMQNQSSYMLADIFYCPLPPMTYASSLQKLNIDADAIETMLLFLAPNTPEEQLRIEHLATLKITRLYVHSQYKDFLVRYFFKLEGKEKLDLSKAKRLDIDCGKRDRYKETTNLPPIEWTVVDQINVMSCILPGPYILNALRDLNITFSGKRVEYSHSIRDYPEVMQSAGFEGLYLKELYVSCHKEGLVKLEDDFFKPLVPYLRVLELWRINLATLPESSRLVNVTLKGSASIGPLGGCSELQWLKIKMWQIPKLDGWLAHCPKLRELVIEQLPEQDINRTLNGAKTLRVLTIQRCAITYLSAKLLSHAVNLEKLTFSELTLGEMHSQAFASQSHLKSLDISGNGLSLNWNINNMLNSLPELRNLSLADNPELGFCIRYYIKAEADQKAPPMLEQLSLHRTQMDELCFGESWDTLSYLDLSANNVSELQFYELPSPKKKPMEVDLRGNPLQIFPSTRQDYGMMIYKFKEIYNLTVWVDITLDCDCRHGWFARALRSLPRLHLIGAKCYSGNQLSKEPYQSLECNKFRCGGCYCRRTWRDNMTIADCQGAGLRSIPDLTEVSNLRQLLASNNHIDKLQAQDFVDTLSVINLHDNRISRISDEVLFKLFEVPGRNISLAGNPFVCDCENEPLVTALQKYRLQVTDFDKVTCVGDGVEVFSIGDVDTKLLCSAVYERNMLVLAATGGSFLALAAVTAVLLYRYWRELKIFLYARGWCLFCVTEHEVDSDRKYDAFISFAHDDEEFIVDKLLPWLDQQEDLKICMHTRDWMPGEPILTQIVRSVEQSRRTVILLSKNFLRSVWGMLEFRTAHVNALREGRVRVVVIVLDDVVDDKDIDPELRRYLRTNTYLRWGAPRFWERLRYALPHKGSGNERVTQQPAARNTVMEAFPQIAMGPIIEDSTGF